MRNFHELAATIFCRSNSRKGITLFISLCEILFVAVFLSSSTKGIQQPVLAWHVDNQVLSQVEPQPATPTPEPTPITSTITPLLKSPVPTSTPTPEPAPIPEPTPIPKPTVMQAQSEQTIPQNPIRYPVNSLITEKPVVFLTFDDGYDSKAISTVLTVLLEREIKCTFFIIGEALRNYPALWKQAVDEGHLICNHTATHEYLSKLSEEGIIKEISGWEDAVVEVLGEEYLHRMRSEFPYIRLPGGMGSNSEKIMRILSEKNYLPIGWSIETAYEVLSRHNLKTESVEPIANQITAHVTSSAKGGSIILLHFNSYDVLTLDKTLKGIKEKGLEFKLIPEAFEVP